MDNSSKTFHSTNQPDILQYVKMFGTYFISQYQIILIEFLLNHFLTYFSTDRTYKFRLVLSLK